jgi:hypothetical protein
MAFAIRIWPIEFDRRVRLDEWGPLRYDGSLGAEAPWRFEPSYWDPDALRANLQPVAGDSDLTYQFDLTRDEARSLDASFRTRALPWMAETEFSEMDRALDEDSPFAVFRVVIFEWESGLE